MGTKAFSVAAQWRHGRAGAGWQGWGRLAGLDRGSHPGPSSQGSRWAIPEQSPEPQARRPLECLQVEAGIRFLWPEQPGAPSVALI